MTSERRTVVEFSALLAGLEQPLQLVTDAERRHDLEVYIAAARPHVERAAFDVLSQAVSAFNDASHEQKARLEYSEGRLYLTVSSAPEPAEPETAFDDSDLDKVTLRLPKELKRLIDGAAGRHGLSANNWYVRELSRVIARGFSEPGPGGQRGDRRGAYRGRRSSLKGFVGGE